MLYIIESLSDPLLQYIKDDPVRPEIPTEFRVSDSSEIFVLMKDNKPSAIVCVAYRDFVPKDCEELYAKNFIQLLSILQLLCSIQFGATIQVLEEI